MKTLTEAQQMNVLLQGPEQLRQFETEQARLWGSVIRENGIKADG
jgi:hypothetical protein